MPSPRRLALALALAALALAGCTSPVGEPSPGSAASPTASADLAATTAWANTVCVEVQDVSTALYEVGGALAIDPLAGTEGLDQARARVESRLSVVDEAVDGLRAVIAAAPEDPVSQEAKASLESTLGEVVANQNEASEQARGVFDAGSVPDAVAAAARAASALQSALGGVGDLVGTATGSGSEEVRAAFAEAPQCASSGR